MFRSPKEFLSIVIVNMYSYNLTQAKAASLGNR